MTWRNTIDRLSPLWLGVAISGSLLVLFFSIETALGRWDGLRAAGDLHPFARVSTGILRDVRLAIVHCLLVGYLLAAFLYAMRNGRQAVLILQDALNCTREECLALAELVKLRPLWLVTSGIAGVLLALALPYLTPPVPNEPWNPSSWSPEVVWHRVLGPPMLVFLLWLWYAVVIVSTRFSRLATKLHSIDLLDLSSLAPFARVGLTNALLLIGALSIASLMLIESGLGFTIVLLGAPGTIVAVLAVVAPARGVHKRIRQSKNAELAQINKAIAETRNAFQDPGCDHSKGELADLIAYRGLIDEIPEWPFTTSTYARLVLYLLIPAVSWTLGVVFEEIVNRALF